MKGHKHWTEWILELNDIRIKKGITQKEIAEVTGKDKSAISHFFNPETKTVPLLSTFVEVWNYVENN